MKLLIDIGNSRVKWAFATGNVLVDADALAHDGRPALTLERIPAHPVQAIWLTHVTGAAHEAAIVDILRTRYGVQPQLARAAPHWYGLHNGYREPERLGVDRWLAMMAAWREAQPGAQASCVVDAGTALTADVIAGDGRHLGGFIAAGLQTQQRAVLGATRFATRETETPFLSGLGIDTESCVRQGALLACLGAIERAARQAGASARCVITGGDAPILLAHLPAHWKHDPNLVLHGLRALSEAS